MCTILSFGDFNQFHWRAGNCHNTDALFSNTFCSPASKHRERGFESCSMLLLTTSFGHCYRHIIFSCFYYTLKPLRKHSWDFEMHCISLFMFQEYFHSQKSTVCKYVKRQTLCKHILWSVLSSGISLVVWCTSRCPFDIPYLWLASVKVLLILRHIGTYRIRQA